MREREREVQTHYDIQIERRSADVDDWNRQRKVMAYGKDLRMSKSELRNASYGTLVGPGGQCPSHAQIEIACATPPRRAGSRRSSGR